MTDILLRPATHLRDDLASRRVGAEELLDATLARIAALNPRLNAVVAIDEAGARRAARESDARLAAGAARPLEGLPITIKDAFDVAGIVSTAGAKQFHDRVPEVDAAAVARLRRAGAVILGKTLVPTFSGDFQAFNPLHGTANNPFDLARSPGGSSGGAAAAVACGLSSFELGSDFGGSIRWPAHACGLFGLKPSYGTVSTRGHVPPPPGTATESDFAVAGPIARSAADLETVLAVLAGPADPDAPAPDLAPPLFHEPERLRVAVWSDDPLAPVDAPVKSAVEGAASRLAAIGAEIDLDARPDFAFADFFETFALFNHAIVASGLKQETRDRLAARAHDFAPGDRSHEALQARGARLDAETYALMRARRRAFAQAFADFFERFDVILCPPAPVPAIPHDHRPDLHARTFAVNGAARPYFDFLVWSSLATLPGLPAAVVPVHRSGEGLPCGVQIVARAGAERTALAVARLLEEQGCRFVPPPLAASLS